MRILSLAQQAPPNPSSCTHLHENCDQDSAKYSGDNGLTPTAVSKFPTVSLDCDVVTDTMAATLSTTLLSHILFLKSQVPFPVTRLSRMPGAEKETRASKKRHDLVEAFDLLVSHMNTTFTALSTALALALTSQSEVSGDNETAISAKKKKIAPVYLAYVLGPTVGSAKARVMVGIHGLEPKIWGQRDDDSDESGPNAQDYVEQETSYEEDDTLSSLETSKSVSESEQTDEDEDEYEDEDADDRDSSGESSVDDQHSDSDLNELPPQSPSLSPSPAPSYESPSTMTTLSYAEEQQALRTAERLLSRTLASAYAEDNGQEMVCEMAPTQTHVLIRAPRCFVHPAWEPRQNLSNVYDAFLEEFLAETRGEKNKRTDKRGSKKAGQLEGVWIKCRESSDESLGHRGEVIAEEEMIWWIWTEKLVGFTDWQ